MVKGMERPELNLVGIMYFYEDLALAMDVCYESGERFSSVVAPSTVILMETLSKDIWGMGDDVIKKYRIEQYELYKDKINYTGFHKIWLGKTWKHIMPEVFSESNIAYHTHDTGNTGIANGRAILTAEDVRIIRHRRDNGDDMKTVYNDYESKISYKYMYNIWTNITWKNIV